jgi:hypothetical protein
MAQTGNFLPELGTMALAPEDLDIRTSPIRKGLEKGNIQVTYTGIIENIFFNS